MCVNSRATSTRRLRMPSARATPPRCALSSPMSATALRRSLRGSPASRRRRTRKCANRYRRSPARSTACKKRRRRSRANWKISAAKLPKCAKADLPPSATSSNLKLRYAKHRASCIPCRRRAQASRPYVNVLKKRYVRVSRSSGPPSMGGSGRKCHRERFRKSGSVQEKRRRDIERLKIKIEESGIGNGEQVVTEFKQTKERDEFLARELVDLERSAASLKDIIAELEKTIDARFHTGLKHINEALKNFLRNCSAAAQRNFLSRSPVGKSQARRAEIEDEEDDEDIPEEEELYAGLSIDVSLPARRYAGLKSLRRRTSAHFDSAHLLDDAGESAALPHPRRDRRGAR